MRIINKLRRTFYIWRDKSAVPNYGQIEGFLSPYEAVSLYRLASKLGQESTIVEIGSWKGKSTYCLARGLRSGHVIAIDPFDAAGEQGSHEIYITNRGAGPLLEQFTQRMTSLGVADKIDVLQGYSTQFVGHIPHIDLLFIDGDHSIDGCGFDFFNYSPALASGGYIAFHDYDPRRKDLGPTWVIEQKLMPSGLFRPIGVYDSLWVGQKV